MTRDGYAHVINSDGSMRWTYTVPANPVTSYSRFQFTSESTNMLVYDLDGDGNREVVFSSAGWVHFLDAKTGVEKARFDAGVRATGRSLGRTFITDWDGDGHADVVSTAQYVAVGESPFVITSASNDWLPASKFHGQFDFRGSSFDDSGRVLFDTSAPREFRNPKQMGTLRDPREALGTSFGYAANDGNADSNDAKVFIEIAPPNSPPVFTSRPPAAVLGNGANELFNFYTASAVDPDVGDTVTYSLESFGIGFLGENNTTFFQINPTSGAVLFGRGLAFGNFSVHMTITATDSQGAKATQSFVVQHSTTAVTVPNVTGALLRNADQILTAAQLQSRVLEEQFSAQPVGTVIAHPPAAVSRAVPRCCSRYPKAWRPLWCRTSSAWRKLKLTRAYWRQVSQPVL
jgi:hypothetical protein